MLKFLPGILIISLLLSGWACSVTNKHDILLKRGDAFYNTGQYSKAIDAFQKALRIDPENADVWYMLRVAYRETGEHSKAIEFLKQYQENYPEHVETWYSLGVAYAETGQYPKAIDAFQKALRIDPENANVWFSLGVAYEKMDQSLKAIDVYEQALKIFLESDKHRLLIFINKPTVMKIYHSLRELDTVSADEFLNNSMILRSC